MDYLIAGGLFLFGLTIVFFIWQNTKAVPNISILTEDFQVDEFEVSYVFLPTDSDNEYGRIKGFSYKRNQTITTVPHYKETHLKFGDIVKYRYLGNQFDNVELV